MLYSKKEKGTVLILVLWTIVFLGILALALSRNVGQEVRAVQILEDRVKTRVLARSGVEIAKRVLVADLIVAYDSLNESWANSPEHFVDVPIGEAGTLSIGYLSKDENNRFVPGLIDEDRKISLNKASIPILTTLFYTAGGVDLDDAADIAASIQDWRDDDDYKTQGGAEKSYYQGEGYVTKDGSFEVLEELLLVKGITPEIYARVKDYLTVYSAGLVNINTAPYDVLRALGFGQIVANKILLFRQGEDGKAGTVDDRMFLSQASVMEELQTVVELDGDEITEISQVLGSNMIDIKSDYFLVHSTAKLAGKETSTHFSCVIDRKGAILRWIEN